MNEEGRKYSRLAQMIIALTYPLLFELESWMCTPIRFQAKQIGLYFDADH